MQFHHIPENTQDALSYEGIRQNKDGTGKEAYEILGRPSPNSSTVDSQDPPGPIQPIPPRQGESWQQTPPTLQLASLSLHQQTEHRNDPLFSRPRDAYSHGNHAQENYSDWDGYPASEDDRGTFWDGILRPDHPFQSVREIILQSASEEIRSWMTTARYIVPPDHTTNLRKWARATAWQRGSAYAEEVVDDGETVILSRISGYLHWACPYYASDPTKYLDCLVHHDFQSIEDVISHLVESHLEPPYCPRCRQTFASATNRDQHFYANVCEFRTEPDVAGITPLQRMRLEDEDDSRTDERTRWQRAWAIIFPRDTLRRSPYLDSSPERTVSMIRDFWASHGMRIISEHLMSHGIVIEDNRDDMEALVAVYSSILRDLLVKAIGEQNFA